MDLGNKGMVMMMMIKNLELKKVLMTSTCLGIHMAKETTSR